MYADLIICLLSTNVKPYGVRDANPLFLPYIPGPEACYGRTGLDRHTGELLKIVPEPTDHEFHPRIEGECYPELLNTYLFKYIHVPEKPFDGPDGQPCGVWTAGLLSHRRILGCDPVYIGKEGTAAVRTDIEIYAASAKVGDTYEEDRLLYGERTEYLRSALQVLAHTPAKERDELLAPVGEAWSLRSRRSLPARYSKQAPVIKSLFRLPLEQQVQHVLKHGLRNRIVGAAEAYAARFVPQSETTITDYLLGGVFTASWPTVAGLQTSPSSPALSREGRIGRKTVHIGVTARQAEGQHWHACCCRGPGGEDARWREECYRRAT